MLSLHCIASKSSPHIGQLFEISSKQSKNPKASREEQQRWYSAFCRIGNERGYKPGWLGNKFRDKFDHWPRGLSDRPAKADVPCPRRNMPGRIPDGSSARLAPRGPVLGVSEGVENAFAITKLFGVPA
jgi:hypothetical protein